MRPNDPHWPRMSPNDPHWPRISPKDPHWPLWAPTIHIDHVWAPSIYNDCVEAPKIHTDHVWAPTTHTDHVLAPTIHTYHVWAPKTPSDNSMDISSYPPHQSDRRLHLPLKIQLNSGSHCCSDWRRIPELRRYVTLTSRALRFTTVCGRTLVTERGNNVCPSSLAAWLNEDFRDAFQVLPSFNHILHVNEHFVSVTEAHLLAQRTVRTDSSNKHTKKIYVEIFASNYLRVCKYPQQNNFEMTRKTFCIQCRVPHH